MWPDRDGGELLGQTIAQTTGRGTRVITRGPIRFDSYVNKDGEQKGSWAQNVYGIGAEIRTPQTMSSAQVAVSSLVRLRCLSRMSRSKKDHVCEVQNGECVDGKIYEEGLRRIACPLCNCSCHLKPGEKKQQ